MALPRLAVAVIGDEIGPSLSEMISFCAENDVRRLDMRTVEDIEFQQRFLERLLGIGEIVVVAADKRMGRFRLLGVENPRELRELLEAGKKVALIDVRERVEWDINHIDGAQLIPKSLIDSGEGLAKLPRRSDDERPDEPSEITERVHASGDHPSVVWRDIQRHCPAGPEGEIG